MYNVRWFPSFRPSPTANRKDRAFLKVMQHVKTECGASYVNFSAHRKSHENSANIHFITYPISWITRYMRFNYQEVDPLIHFDHRNVSLIDWEELRRGRHIDRFFEDFKDHGLGNHGMLMSTLIGEDIHGVSIFSFNTPDEEWAASRAERVEILRFLSQTLCDEYERLYTNQPARAYNITKRERECLYWVALGKTDREIGQLLDIGRWTVISHIKSAKYKLGSTNRTAAVANAMAYGIIKLDKSPIDA